MSYLPFTSFLSFYTVSSRGGNMFQMYISKFSLVIHSFCKEIFESGIIEVSPTDNNLRGFFWPQTVHLLNMPLCILFRNILDFYFSGIIIISWDILPSLLWGWGGMAQRAKYSEGFCRYSDIPISSQLNDMIVLSGCPCGWVGLCFQFCLMSWEWKWNMSPLGWCILCWCKTSGGLFTSSPFYNNVPDYWPVHQPGFGVRSTTTWGKSLQNVFEGYGINE